MNDSGDMSPAALALDISVQPHIPVGQIEKLPKWLIVIPMVAQWLWLSLRYRSLTLPTAANPAITAGGLAGEGKSEYFRIMGPKARTWIADYTLLKNDAHGATPERAEALMAERRLTYPLIVKPDIGWCGFGVRLVRDRNELNRYLAAFPQGENIILQQFIAHEGEAGLYYVRPPDEARGKLVGILLRDFPRVVGDGHSSIAQLISQNARARRIGQATQSEPCCNTSRIPAAVEIVRLSIAASTRVGGLYQDATSLITPALEDAINGIALDMPQLHVARLDVRYESLGALREGRGFKIIEINGAGSEAVHAWDPRYSLHQSYRIVFAKQRLLFEMGARMRERGYRPAGLRKALRLFNRQRNLIRRYPPSN